MSEQNSEDLKTFHVEKQVKGYSQSSLGSVSVPANLRQMYERVSTQFLWKQTNFWGQKDANNSAIWNSGNLTKYAD